MKKETGRPEGYRSAGNNKEANQMTSMERRDVEDEMLYQFPEGSYAIESSKPYMEVAVGVRNIFKVFGVDYVRRLNYLDHPGVKKNGVRFNLTLSF